MSKPKTYVGPTYSNPWDHGGKDYRWDKKKQEYVVSRGESPMASIKRSWDQKIVPLAQQAEQILANKGPIESRGIKRNPKDEAVNYFAKLIEDPSIPDQVRYPLEQASLSMQNLFELTNEEDATLSWVNSFKADPPVQPAYEQPVSNEKQETPKKEVKGQGNQVRPQKKYDDSFIEDDLDLADRKIEGRTVIPDNPNRKGYVGGKKISEIQKELLKAGHTKEDLSALMEANKNRPKVTDLLKIFRKG